MELEIFCLFGFGGPWNGWDSFYVIGHETPVLKGKFDDFPAIGFPVQSESIHGP